MSHKTFPKSNFKHLQQISCLFQNRLKFFKNKLLKLFLMSWDETKHKENPPSAMAITIRGGATWGAGPLRGRGHEVS